MNYAIIVAVIGAFASILTVAFTRGYEQKIELRKIKEKQYIDFLSFLAKDKLATEKEKKEIEAELSARIQTIYLVGNKEVQLALTKFLGIFFQRGEKPQEELYGKLILEMKKDLYGKKFRKDSTISVDKVCFTIFGENKSMLGEAPSERLFQ